MLQLNVIIKMLICLSAAEFVFEKGDYFRMTVIKRHTKRSLDFSLKYIALLSILLRRGFEGSCIPSHVTEGRNKTPVKTLAWEDNFYPTYLKYLLPSCRLVQSRKPIIDSIQ